MKEKNRNKDIYASIPEGCNREFQLCKSKVAETPNKDTRGWSVANTRWVMAETLKSCGRRFLGWSMGNTRAWNKAFTLIELLVVVLIIGILAAIAIPQYQKAVEKTKATEAIELLNAVYGAAERYFMANNTWPTSFEELDIQIPWKGNIRFDLLVGSTAWRSNQDWSIYLYSTNLNTDNSYGVGVGRITGKYKGAMFWKYQRHSRIDMLNRIICGEKKSNGYYLFSQPDGSYCQKIFGGKYKFTTTVRYYDIF